MSNETIINFGFANRWSPFRQLHQMVTNAVQERSQRVLPDLETLLIKHKTDFISLLKNPSRNALHKEIVLNASKDGITIIQQQNRVKQIIPQIMIDEALLMSQMFDLNELSALELIIAGENQESRFGGLSRGPIAVLLYLDGRKSLLSCLHNLIQYSCGRTWTLKVNRDLSRVINKFTANLKSEGVVTQCIDQLSTLDIRAEFDLLERNRALGSFKFRKQVLDILKDIRRLLAEIIYCYSAQTDLSPHEVLSLIDLISKIAKTTPNGSLDSVTTTLLMSLLSVIDVSFLQTSEENDKRISNNSILKNPELIKEIEKQLNRKEFCVKEIATILRFGLALSLKTLSLYPVLGIDVELEEEKLIDFAIEEKVFESMNYLIGFNEFVSNEEFYIRRIHNMITDFIVLFPIRIKELKDKGDEIGRIINAYTAEGIQPPTTLPRHFEKLLYFMAQLYSEDNFKITQDFWPALSEGKQTTHKHQSLHKFIRTIQDSFFPPVLHIPVIKLLKSLSISYPFNVFNLIKGQTLHLSSQFSMDYFNNTLIQYYNNVRGTDNKDKVNASTNQFGFNNIPLQIPGQHRLLTGIESEIVCAIIELIEVIVKNDKTCCLAIAENHQYSIISSLIGILRCAVPKELKAAILNCLSGFASSSSSVSFMIWSKIDGILPKYMPSVTSGLAGDHLSQHRLWQNGIGIEIEEIEVKNEEYPITIGFVKLMKSLFSHCDGSQSPQQQSSAEVCLNFVINSILLKTNARVFKVDDQKWTLIRICYEIILSLIENYEPSVEGPNSRAAFFIFTQILQESGLFRQIMTTLEDIVDSFEKQIHSISFERENSFPKLTEDCALNALKILNSICNKQSEFIDMIHEIQGFPLAIIAKFDVLFNNVNPRTGAIDRLSTLLRLIHLPTQASIETLKVLNSLCKSNLEISHLCLIQLQSFDSKTLTNEYIVNTFVECLESESKELRLETLNLIDTCLDFVHISYSFNFGHKLLGIDRSRGALKEAGSLGQSFTCFHSILAFFDSTVNEVNEFLEERRIGMKILYKLCSSLSTYENVLRYLRTSYDFMVQYLHSWESMRSDPNYENQLLENLFQELTYFLYILAIDIKITSEQKLKSHCSTYVTALFNPSKKGRLLDMLSPKVFIHNHPVLPNLEFFEQKGLWKAISECSAPNKTIDLKSLHQRLLNEVRLYGPQLGVIQTNLVRTELKTILSFGADINESQQKLITKTNFLDSFRELLEILIISRTLDILDEESRLRYLMEIIVELLNKASDSMTSTSLLSPISSGVLIVSSALFGIKSQALTSNIMICIKSVINILESSSSVWSEQKITRINLYASLLYLFRCLPSNLFNEYKYKHRFLERLSKDMLSGHEVAKVLAISLLNRSDTSIWLNELSSNGTLRQLLDTISSDDKQIRDNNFEFIKLFYGFEAKMMLLLQIYSSSNVIHSPLHDLDLISTINSIQSFDMYPYLVGKNTVCHKVFVDILRLIQTFSTTNNQQILNELSEFVNCRTTFSDILRMAPNIKSTSEGKEVILLITKTMSRLIRWVNPTNQISFIGLLSHYSNEFSSSEDLEIIFNILFGCIQYSRTNAFLPLFEPNLASHESRLITNQPLGLLVTVLNNCCIKSNDKCNVLAIVETALYLLWHHLNLYFSVLNVPEEKQQDIDNMKNQCQYILSDAFFAKIQNISEKNTFVDALVRRIKRIIFLKKTI